MFSLFIDDSSRFTDRHNVERCSLNVLPFLWSMNNFSVADIECSVPVPRVKDNITRLEMASVSVCSCGGLLVAGAGYGDAVLFVGICGESRTVEAVGACCPVLVRFALLLECCVDDFLCECWLLWLGVVVWFMAGCPGEERAGCCWRWG